MTKLNVIDKLVILICSYQNKPMHKSCLLLNKQSIYYCNEYLISFFVVIATLTAMRMAG